jgi:thiamine-phosphate pyrophosphorylase
MIPQFYLITPPIADPLAFRPTLEALLSTGAVAVLLARFVQASDAEAKRLATALKGMVQEAGAAFLIDAPEDARLVARLGLDGAHVPRPGPMLSEAISALKPERIVGIGGLRSRHDAMEAGEADIDYVMFGEPRGDGSLPDLMQTIERAEWWATIFNIPCIAYAPDLDAIAPLSATGAEFIALGPCLFETEDPAEALAEARRRAKSTALQKPEAG